MFGFCRNSKKNFQKFSKKWAKVVDIMKSVCYNGLKIAEGGKIRAESGKSGWKIFAVRMSISSTEKTESESPPNTVRNSGRTTPS